MPENWKTTADLRTAAEVVYENLRKGMIDVDVARTLGAQIRTAAKLAAVELDAMKQAGKELDKKTMKLSKVELS